MKTFIAVLILASVANAAVPKTAPTVADKDRDAMVEALSKSNFDIAKKLHKKGVSYDVLSSTEDISGLMQLADDGDDTGVVAALNLGANINAKNSVGETALWYATYSGHESLALELIKHGASAEGQRADSKECLLHMAVQADLVKLSEKLMKLTPKCAEVKDQDGKTPAVIAKSLGYKKLAKIVTPSKSTGKKR